MPDLTPVEHLANVICPDRSEGGSPHGVCVAKARVLLDALCWSPGIQADLARVLYEAQGYEDWDNPLVLPRSKAAAYKMADAVLAWLTGTEEAADA